MRVADLIAELQSMDKDAEVHFSYNYGDHWRTEVAPRVTSIGEGVVEFSDYHRMDRLVEEDYDDEDSCGEDVQTQRRVVVIS